MPNCTGIRFPQAFDFPPCAIGEPAFVNGLKIIASYDDNTERVIPVAYKMFNDSNMYSKGDDRACFIVFEGQKLRFTVPTVQCTLDHIEVKILKPLEFQEGEMFQREKIKVTAFYDNGCSKEVFTYKITPYAPLTPSQKQITIKYGRQTQALEVNVVPNSLEISSVKISTMPQKMKYLLGDTKVDLSGGQLQVIYSNGKTEEVEMIPDDDPSLESDRVGRGKVEFLYHRKRVYFFVDILTPAIEHVEIKQMPFKQEYLEGDNLDLNGLILCVKYNDGSERDVSDLDNGTFLMCKSHTQTGANLTYKGYPFTIPVIVRKAKEKIELSHIFVATPPSKQKFIIGDSLDFTGAQLMLQYSNGKRELVDITPDMIKSGDCSKEGVTNVIIEYKDQTVEEPITVYRREIDHLEIIHPPKKTQYIEHESVNVDGLVLGVCYNNGDKEEVQNYAVSPKICSLEMSFITIQYCDLQIQYPVAVEPISVVELDWESIPEKRDYFIHEKNFVCFGGILKVKYNTGETKNVPLSADMVSEFCTEEAGPCTIIVSYGGKSLPFTITIHNRVLLGIQIKQMPRTYYMAGERFNSEGMKIEAVYSGGSNEEVEFTFRPDRPLRADDNFVVIAHQDKAVMLDLTVTEPQPEPKPLPEPEPETCSELETKPEFEPDSKPGLDSKTTLNIDDVIDSNIPMNLSSAAEHTSDTSGAIGDPADARSSVDESSLEDAEQDVEKEPKKRVEVPHFYPSTFCVRFQTES